MARRRADQLLVDRGLVESRTRAQALILAGKVFSGEQRVSKAGDLLAEDAALDVRGQDHPWVSRGGLKLDHALTHFGLDPAGRVCLDIGASTGCIMARRGCTPSMSGTANWPGSCAPIRAWWCMKNATPAI